eukprot:TRINITY_DN18531_c1_g1_i1.p1 TRINITY_DN18531_c1_g1~~TRINITY_DN18531_c1_g1_i1.p1  ORF type:complete len:171 (-),score=29.31 TRINITY_DN18531_c1_g1_i1:137-649(-)
MDRRRPHYELLGIPEDASPRSIERAWKREALRCHPDKVPEGEKEAAEERFKALSNAHEVLADPERRRLYDAYGDEMAPPRPSYTEMEEMFEAELLRAMFEAASAQSREREPERSATEELRDGVLGLGILGGAIFAWWALAPALGRCLTWLSWQWRFLMYDVGVRRRCVVG